MFEYVIEHGKFIVRCPSHGDVRPVCRLRLIGHEVLLPIGSRGRPRRGEENQLLIVCPICHVSVTAAVDIDVLFSRKRSPDAERTE